MSTWVRLVQILEVEAGEVCHAAVVLPQVFWEGFITARIAGPHGTLGFLIQMHRGTARSCREVRAVDIFYLCKMFKMILIEHFP